MFDVLRVPPNPRREFPRNMICFVSEVREIEVVSATGVRVNGELITENERAVFDNMVNCDQTFESYC